MTLRWQNRRGIGAPRGSRAAAPGRRGEPGAVEALAIAVDAYIYGYPLVTFDMVRGSRPTSPAPMPSTRPMGQMILMRSYPAVDNHCCAAPNADTLYTMAWLDVSKQPYVFAIPEMGDRYYIMPFLDGWSEVFAVASQPLNGGAAQTYAVTGPGWTGTLPDGRDRAEVAHRPGLDPRPHLQRRHSTTDYDAVHALQDQFTARPAQRLGQGLRRHRRARSIPPIDMTTAVRQPGERPRRRGVFRPAGGADGGEPADRRRRADGRSGWRGSAWCRARTSIPDKLDFLDREMLKTVPKLALLEMGLHLKRQPTTDGWLYFTKGVGNWGTDYLTRAMGNLLGPGWNRPEDAIYPLSQKDGAGDGYDGAKHAYVLRFEKGALPPAKAFWSLTMYDPDFFFVPNPINRYELSQRNTFVTGPDGSIELYLQAESPGKDKEANWLPAPKGKFALVLRLYDPATAAPSILDGSWTPPGVTVAR